jgi:hypothetical protein
MKKEAIERMKLLKLHPTAIKEFEQTKLLNVSEPPLGSLFWVNKEQEKVVRNFEAEFGGLVYHIVHSYTTFGELLNIFYVSEHKEEWEMDRNNILECCACVYVKNLTDDDCSEFGYIGFKSVGGGVVRTE